METETRTTTESGVEQTLSALDQLRDEISRVIVGQREVVDQLLICLLARGHALLEGVPGLGKTLLVKTLAQATELDFKRVQFTPDLMPGDILGTEILEEDHGTGKRFFKFQRGPIFTNILLADEINRTPPKTQAALLESMQEYAVTMAGETMALPRPYFVLATQNPIEQAGTYPLPEAQLDRFLLNIHIDYPGEEDEIAILRGTTGGEAETPSPCLDGHAIIEMQRLVREVHISDDLYGYIARLVRTSRPVTGSKGGKDSSLGQWIQWGAGPRAGQALVLAAKARALLNQRLAVTRADIRALLLPVLRHRILLSFHAQAEGVGIERVIDELLRACPEPGQD
ncbi:Denitrification regulatory protein NirQ [Microbulbifer aggregans]|uniref:Denitrification regulatory protein NirQ n=1 Tax=Microbulbifer aggregans TaxID=1769779 RepID=A0A1C9W5N5_9GAMM|nr:MoxR family ATPase [Microbulbifer aggregans]AOS96461.1 Denitrification regulatory protein NirQ [Microbulbifer aggregans]